MSRAARTLRERFDEKAQKSTGCWLWTGTRDSKGYGVLKVYPKRMLKAHRIAWELFNGPIPAGTGYHGTVVMHMCDNPGCVNPAHLQIGTTGDNNADRKRKGRSMPRRGEQSALSRLSADQVRQLRQEYALLPLSSTGRRKREGAVPALAERYGITDSYVRELAQGKKWRHL